MSRRSAAATAPTLFPIGEIDVTLFGKKHLHKPLIQVIEEDPDYIDWILEQETEPGSPMGQVQVSLRKLMNLPENETPAPQPQKKKLKMKKLGRHLQCSHCGGEEFNVTEEKAGGLSLICTKCATTLYYSLIYGQQPVCPLSGYENDIPSLFERAG